MQHPFEGILDPTGTPRRDVLKTLVAGSAAALAISPELLSAEDKPTAEAPAKAADYNRYLVIPKNFSAFRTARRTKLGIGGGYFRVAPSKDVKVAKAGYLGWLTAEAAEKLSDEMDIKEVFRIEAKDIAGPGKKPDKATQLMVRLSPNGWRQAVPPKGSYVSTADLIGQFSKKHKDVKFQPAKSETYFLVNIGPAGMPESLIKDLTAHPQVVGVSWSGGATITTLAIGEEGATTKALGEEGASTRRLGEEGGVSTKALGEEGGVKPSTRRLGEEGGRPPVGKPTTLALGEEGGKK